jgi:ubiquinone/menaquinone biosynthesis C-methylase UbiE
MHDHDDLAKYYYLDLAAAYVRGSRADAPVLSDLELVRHGLSVGLRLHRFKRTTELPRIRRVLGILRGMHPDNVLDVGSGRGVFLWPLLDAFPKTPVTAIDRLDHRIDEIQMVIDGGVDRLRATVGDVTDLDFPDDSFDVTTILEVLEHLPKPGHAVEELIRVTRRCIVVSVPSKPDENPEHLHLFDESALRELFSDKRVNAVRCEHVLNHLVAVIPLAKS